MDEIWELVNVIELIKDQEFARVGFHFNDAACKFKARLHNGGKLNFKLNLMR